MSHQVGSILFANAVSYDVAIDDAEFPEVINVVFHGEDGSELTVSFGYEDDDGVEIRTLNLSGSLVQGERQQTIAFPTDVSEVLVRTRYFNSGRGRMLNEVSDIRLSFSDGTWLQLQPGQQVSDLIMLSRSS